MDASITIRLPALARAADDGTGASEGLAREEFAASASDETLMAGVREGSRESLTILFRRYARLVRGVALRILRDSSEADDCLQDVFLFVHRKAGVFDPSKASARSWIVQMSYQRAIDRYRYLHSRHFYTHLSLDDDAMDVTDPRSEWGEQDQEVDGAAPWATLPETFASLSEDQRDTLRRYFFEGQTFKEIAAAQSQTLGNVRNHYYRGLEKMRKQIFGRERSSRKRV
jgi:RNA polymerase sigma-70 factor (ECF subfamily)